MFRMKVDVRRDERAFVHVDERPVRYLEPGRHHIARRPRHDVEVHRSNTRELVAKLTPEQVALVPERDLAVVRVSERERAVVRRFGVARHWLGPGEHFVWTVERRARAESDEPAVTIETLDVSGVDAEPLRDDVRAVAPATELVSRLVAAGHSGLRFVDGELDAVLPPGRHSAWAVERHVEMAVIDLRERILAVSGQEVMTSDHVSLRMNLAAAYRIADVERLTEVARDPDELLYLAVQVASRQTVAARTLDELLACRDVLAGEIRQEVVTRAEAVGLHLVQLALKDIVLPGEMRTLLNQVLEARKQAEANVILRREEAATTRSLAQTAKVLADNPVLMRLRELEALQEVAGRVGKLEVRVGDDALGRLKLETTPTVTTP